jgi:phycoerythrin-associated linker protein
MVSTFINTRVNSDASLGVISFDDTQPIRLTPTSSAAAVEIAIRAVYRQVLGNAHVMESERLIVAESQLQRGDASVRGFVRQVAQSNLYRQLFFENCSRTRSIELNFKHLLGRAPESYAEIAEHGQLLDLGGFELEIASYIDSDEYLDAFGEDIVPYYQGHKSQTGKKMVGFTHLFQLLRGSASSDKDPIHNNRARLNTSLMSDQPSSISPVQGAPSPWQAPGSVTDVSQMISDVDAILAQVFQRQEPELVATPTTWTSTRDYHAAQALQQIDREQAQTIERLQQQLTDLSSFAAIGAAYLSNNGQSAPEAVSHPGKLDTPAAQIAKLQAQIADASRYATIGEARLNKWRSRVFNS